MGFVCKVQGTEQWRYLVVSSDLLLLLRQLALSIDAFASFSKKAERGFSWDVGEAGSLFEQL